jgi:hypothetical protein
MQPVIVNGATLGHLGPDGQIIPVEQKAQTTVPPAPEGDELDALLDECCTWMELSCRKRLSRELQPDGDGRSSFTLTEGRDRWGGNANYGHGGVRSWIVDGTLRDISQLRTVVNDFLDAMEARVRRKRWADPDWKLDNNAMVILGSRFGLDQPKTFEELGARRAEQEAERQRRASQQEVERKQKQDAFNASPEGLAQRRRDFLAAFKREQLDIVLNAIVPSSFSFADPEHPTEEERTKARAQGLLAARERNHLSQFIKPVVEHTNLSASAIVRIWQEAEENFMKMLEEFEEFEEFEGASGSIEDFCAKQLAHAANESLRGNPAPLTRTCGIPDVIPGVKRETGKTFADLRPAMTRFESQGWTSTLERDFAGLVLTGVPPEMREKWEAHCDAWRKMLRREE